MHTVYLPASVVFHTSTKTVTASKQHPSISIRLNLGLSALIIVVGLFQFIILPVYLLPLSIHWGWIIVLGAVVVPTLWGLIHEGVHRLLHPVKPVNEGLSRILSIIWGASFHVLAYGHLMHHRLNRRWESEYYDASHSSRLKEICVYYWRLLGGLYFTELMASLSFAFFPQTMGRAIIKEKAQDDSQYIAAEHYFFKPERQAKIRHDMLAVLVIYGGSLVLYGAYWPVWVAMVLGKALVASLLDNIYHYGTPEDNSVIAKEVSASMPIGLLLLHMNYHNTHHRHTTVPWNRLPAHFHENHGEYSESFARAFWNQCKGPIPLV